MTLRLAFLPLWSLASCTEKARGAERVVAGAARAEVKKAAAEKRIVEAFMLGAVEWYFL
jgi:hypothetical protein